MVGRPARRPDRTTVVNSGRRRRRACAGSTSGGELLATLAPTTGEDRRPARVRIRSRKPWVLDRRRLFGWNVRLLTRYSHYTTSAVRPHRWAGTRGATDGDVPRPTTRKLVTAMRSPPCAAPAPNTPGAPHGWTSRPEPTTDCTQHSRGGGL